MKKNKKAIFLAIGLISLTSGCGASKSGLSIFINSFETFEGMVTDLEAQRRKHGENPMRLFDFDLSEIDADIIQTYHVGGIDYCPQLEQNWWTPGCARRIPGKRAHKPGEHCPNLFYRRMHVEARNSEEDLLAMITYMDAVQVIGTPFFKEGEEITWAVGYNSDDQHILVDENENILLQVKFGRGITDQFRSDVFDYLLIVWEEGSHIYV